MAATGRDKFLHLRRQTSKQAEALEVIPIAR